MRRCLATLSLGLAILGGSHPCQAGWSEFWHRVHVDWHRNNCWPVPFDGPDRAATVAPFATMVSNGWRLHNTITHDLFNPETQELNAAGRHAVAWIVTQAPEPRRTVHVLRGANSNATSARLDSVQRLISAIIPEGELPPVLLTDAAPQGGSGDYFDRIERAAQQNMPAPVLPPMQGDGT
ncbi:MAG: hypothetical protein KDA55_05150 [Planctomycetales bacterium]|nr:hypothetical protein [Planctomycetales bacterium]MCA9207719.1 hypothetical protein [Planctomycetales bacterium]MCA9223513.1 hypothetical protein [Planctomycetales bacterium]